MNYRIIIMKIPKLKNCKMIGDKLYVSYYEAEACDGCPLSQLCWDKDVKPQIEAKE